MVLELPSAFSPNEDGQNDLLALINLGIASIEFWEVFNRWGDLVFVTNDLSATWDGTFNGNHLPIGVYFYKIAAKDFKDDEIYKEGNVTLLR